MTVKQTVTTLIVGAIIAVSITSQRANSIMPMAKEEQPTSAECVELLNDFDNKGETYEAYKEWESVQEELGNVKILYQADGEVILETEEATKQYNDSIKKGIDKVYDEVNTCRPVKKDENAVAIM